jgi:RNA polymerase sigma factor (TIGR02999 family)
MSPAPDLLDELRAGRQAEMDRLIPLVYQELRTIAHRQLGPSRKSGSLSTTALVHEAYLKLVDQSRAEWQDQAHFLALASLAMRHVLVDRARALATAKRGGAQQRITLSEADLSTEAGPDELLELDQALEDLARIDSRLAQVVIFRFFGGLTEEQIAGALSVSVRSVQRDWAKARMLLRRALGS